MKKMLINFVVLPLLASPAALAQGTIEKAPSAQATRGAHNAAEFIQMAGSSGMFEVLSSDLALKKATDARVKEFARRMAIEHRGMNDKLVATVRSAQLPPPPTGLAPEHQEIMDRLSTAWGREFDHAYVGAQIQMQRTRWSSSRATPRRATTRSSRASRSRRCQPSRTTSSTCRAWMARL